MTTFQPRDPGYEGWVRAKFARQGLLRTLSALLGDVTPSRIEIALTPGPAISQQHGIVHAGALAAIADSAAGYAALSLLHLDILRDPLLHLARRKARPV